MFLKCALQSLARAANLGEVKLKRHEAVRVFRGVFPDPEIAEDFPEVLLLVAIVVALHHRDEERLAEPTRAHEEDETVTRLHLREKLRLIDIVVPLAADSPEIHDTIRYLEVFSFFCHAKNYIKKASLLSICVR